MYKIFLVVGVLLLSACTFNDTQHLKELRREAQQKESHEGRIYKDVIYKSTFFYDMTLDIYAPLVERYREAPIYLYIHGGSWLHGDKELVNVYDKTIYGLRKAGVAVVSINYRFVSQSGVSAMVMDCRDALLFLQEHAETYGLDMHKIGLHGHSAGANLALVTGLQHSKESDDILFIVDEYGPTDAIKLLKERNDRPWWSYLISDTTLEEISPILMLHSHTPPIYISHGDVDKTVPIEQSLSLYDTLYAAERPVRLEVILGVKHGYRGIADDVLKAHRQRVLSYMLDQYKDAL